MINLNKWHILIFGVLALVISYLLVSVIIDKTLSLKPEYLISGGINFAVYFLTSFFLLKAVEKKNNKGFFLYFTRGY